MKLDLKWEIPQWTMLGAMLTVSAWRWPLSGNRIPVHWGIDGRVDRYGGKFEGLLLMPLIALGIYALLLVMPRFDPGRANYAQFAKSYDAIRVATLALLFVMHCAILTVSAGVNIDMSRLVMMAMGALFIVIGGVMGKIRPNWFSGIRNPWTLSSKTTWIKTHRAGGWTFLTIGILQILSSLFLPPSPALTVMMTMIIGSSLGLSAYSYFVWRDADDKAPPAGTSPAD